MKIRNLLSILFIVMIIISCQTSETNSNKTPVINACELTTLEALEKLVRMKDREDFLVENDFHKTKSDSTIVEFSKCKKLIEGGAFWLEIIDLRKDRSNELGYTTIDNQHYIKIKNKIKKAGIDKGEKQGFHTFTIDNNMMYGFRVYASKDNKPNFYRILVTIQHYRVLIKL